MKLLQFVDEILTKPTKDKEKKVYRKTPYPTSSSSSMFTDDSCGHVASSSYSLFPRSNVKHTNECECSDPTEHKDIGTSCTTSCSSVGTSEYSLFDASLNKNLQSQSFLTSSSDKCPRTSVDNMPIQESIQMVSYIMLKSINFILCCRTRKPAMINAAEISRYSCCHVCS